MSSFWQQRLGQAGQTPAPAPAQPAPAVSNRGAWWQPQVPATVPQQAPAAPVQQVAVPSQANGEQHFGDLIARDNYTTTKAKSAKDSELCPDCDSPNYMRASTSPNSMKQCFNCGYNARFQHSTHGATGIGQSDLPTKAARVQQLNTNNFNPQQIIAKVTI